MIWQQIVLRCIAQGAGRKPTIAWVGAHGKRPNIAIVERKFVPFKLGLKATKAMGITLHLITLTYTAVKKQHKVAINELQGVSH